MSRILILMLSLLAVLATNVPANAASQRYEFVDSRLFGVNFVIGDCFPDPATNACNNSLLLPLEGGFTLDIDDVTGIATLRDADNGGGRFDQSFSAAVDEHLPGTLIDEATYRFEHPRYDTAIQIEIDEDQAYVSGRLRMSGYSASFTGPTEIVTNDDGSMTAILGIRRPSIAIAIPEPSSIIVTALGSLMCFRRHRQTSRNRNKSRTNK